MNNINNKYAPGVATYGAPGAQGNSGKDGYSIFYVPSDNIDDDNIQNAIIGNKYISNNSTNINLTKEIDRKYQMNDLFLTRNGKLYKLNGFDNNRPMFECINENFLPYDTSILNYFEGVIYNKVGQSVAFADATSISKNDISDNDAFNDGVVNIVASNNDVNLLSLYNYDKHTESASVLNVHADTSCFIFDTNVNICIDNLSSSSSTENKCVTVNNKNYYSPIINTDSIDCTYTLSVGKININNYNNEFITTHVFDSNDSYKTTIYTKDSSVIDVSQHGIGCKFIVAANNGGYVNKILKQK